MSSCSVYGAAGGCGQHRDVRRRPADRVRQVQGAGRAGRAADGRRRTSRRRSCAMRPRSAPRRGMRFDLVVNDLAGHAWTEKVIRMDSDGKPWRPFVHILDISQAIDLVLRAPRDVVHGRDLQRRQQRPELPGPRDRRDHRRHVPRMPDPVRRQLRATTATTGRTSTRSASGSRSRRATTSQRGAQQLLEVFRAVDMSGRAVRVAWPHAPEADQAPARDRPDRRAVLLGRPAVDQAVATVASGSDPVVASLAGAGSTAIAG